MINMNFGADAQGDGRNASTLSNFWAKLRRPTVRRAIVTILLGLGMLIPFSLISFLLSMSDEATQQNYGQVVFGAVILGYLAFGVLAPSRAAAVAFIVVSYPGFALIICADPRDAFGGMCDARGGGGNEAFPLLTLWLLGLPTAVGILIGWAIGIRWQGGHLRTRWSH